MDLIKQTKTPKMNKPPKIVIAPQGRFNSLTAGKEYKVLRCDGSDHSKYGYLFIIKSDIDSGIDCLERECGHIDDLDWIIKERES